MVNTGKVRLVFCLCVVSMLPFQLAYAFKQIHMYVLNHYGPALYFEQSSQNNMCRKSDPHRHCSELKQPPDRAFSTADRTYWGKIDDEGSDRRHYSQIIYQIYNFDLHSKSWPHGEWIGSLTYHNPASPEHAFLNLYIGDKIQHHLKLPFNENLNREYCCDLTIRHGNPSLSCYRVGIAKCDF